LGFDGTGTAALADRLEAARVVVFWAEPGASHSAAETAKTQNLSLIDRAFLKFHCPLEDVEGASSRLHRIAEELRDSDKFVLVPVGPKPHVLASGIVAAQMDHVTLLSPYQGGGGVRGEGPQIAAAGKIISTIVRQR